MSASVPPDNTFGLSAQSLEFAHQSSGALLYLLSAFAVPKLSRRACHWAGQQHRSTHLITMTRTFMILLAPCFAVVIMNQDCLAQWLSFWQPCKSPESFSIAYKPGVLPTAPNNSTDIEYIEGLLGLAAAGTLCPECPTLASFLVDVVQSDQQMHKDVRYQRTLATMLTHHSDVCRWPLSYPVLTCCWLTVAVLALHT